MQRRLPLLLALFLGCSSGAQNIFDDSEWILATMNGQPPTTGSRITLIFDGKTAGGYGGCNWYGGGYTASGSQLKIGEVQSTSRACDSLQQESAYQRLLARTASYKVVADRLVLKDKSGNALLEFIRRVPRPMNPADLVGTRWRLPGYDATLAFTADGVSGFAGCRGYTGTYSATGDKIRVTSIFMDATECGKSEGVMLQECQFTTDLAVAFVG